MISKKYKNILFFTILSTSFLCLNSYASSTSNSAFTINDEGNVDFYQKVSFHVPNTQDNALEIKQDGSIIFNKELEARAGSTFTQDVTFKDSDQKSFVIIGKDSTLKVQPQGVACLNINRDGETNFFNTVDFKSKDQRSAVSINGGENKLLEVTGGVNPSLDIDGQGKSTFHQDVKFEKQILLSNGVNIRDYLVPQGGIIMWTGTILPQGWSLCDGTNNTPNLIDRFVYGADLQVPLNEKTGGSFNPRHYLNSEYHSTKAYTGNGYSDDKIVTVLDTNGMKERINITDNSITSDSHIPPYYKLAFIMKL